MALVEPSELTVEQRARIASGGLLAVVGLAVYWWGRRRFSVAADATRPGAAVLPPPVGI